MAPDNFINSFDESLPIQTALQPEGASDVINRASGVELIEKPEPLLWKRQRAFASRWLGRRTVVGDNNSLFFKQLCQQLAPRRICHAARPSRPPLSHRP